MPTVKANVGDTLEVKVNNQLGNETTSIHWHGIHQVGTSHMDGSAGVTQCPIPPGESFTYKFVLDKSGTYWYHSHAGTQYPDGLRGPLIVADPKDPYKGKFDEEHVITLSDWYHDEVPTLLGSFLNAANNQSRPPVPLAGLINDATTAVGPTSLKFQPGKKYKLRLINMSAFTGVLVWFEDHDFEIVEVDGIDVTATTGKMLFITPAQRYSVIIKAKSDATKNYALQAVFDLNPDYRNPRIPFNVNATASLQYDASKPFAAPVKVANFKDVFDETKLKPLTATKLGAVTNSIQYDFNLGFDDKKIPTSFVNGKAYVEQNVPTLYTALSTGKDAANPAVYGQVNPFIVKKGDVVEIIVNNLHNAHHPFHFHGHHFQVCTKAAPGAGVGAKNTPCDDFALVRDTITVEAFSYAVLRFKADNPGVWLFHCHLEWHVPMGLSGTIIEDPLEIQKTIKLPQEHLDVCAAGCWPTEGNAAGNTKDALDLTGAHTEIHHPNPGALFTAKTCDVTPPTTTKGPGSFTTSTLYSTTVKTVTSCPPEVTKCPLGSVTTEAVPWGTTVVPVTTGAAVPTTVVPSNIGTVKPTPTTTGSGLVVTAGAAKTLTSFGAAALAVVAALL